MSRSRASALAVACAFGSLALAPGCNDRASAGDSAARRRHDLLTGGVYVADSEVSLLGMRHGGDYLDTHVQDGVYERLKEGPDVGVKRLDHRWTIESVPGDATYEIKVVAKRVDSTGDSFTFTWGAAPAGAGDCASWSAIGAGCTVSSTSDVTCTGMASLAAGTWNVCVRVEDSITTDMKKEEVSIDALSARDLCGDGSVQPGEECDGAGSATDCCTDVCTFVPSGSTCGDGVCEACNATGGCVPTAAGPGPGCDGAATACSGADTCDGAGACNLNDLAAGAEGTCGACSDCDGAGACAPVVAGVQDMGCDGGDGACSGADECDGGGACIRHDLPPGAEGGCGACADCDGAGACAPVASGEQDVGCDGVATTECELTSFCNGAGGCLGGGLAPPGTVCRAAGGVCDAAEHCTGASPTCPADGFVAAGVSCRGTNGPCDAAETCTGTSADCPADAMAAAGVTCRAPTGACDAAETCDGVSNLCPADQLQAAGAVCRRPNGPCDVAETCDGASPACPADLLEREGVVCRPPAMDCDARETCTGSSARCPTDQLEPDGTSCRYNGVCTYGTCLVP